MNRLLLARSELVPQSSASCVSTISGRQAEHLRKVIKPVIGTSLRAGIVNGPKGMATVVGISDAGYQVEFRVDAVDCVGPEETVLDAVASAPWNVHMIIAMPRPKVLSRVLESLASFGVARISLTNSWRVDKSYLDSARLGSAEIAASLQLGAEQGGHCYLPRITVNQRFMSMIESFAELGAADSVRLLAHPNATRGIEDVVAANPAVATHVAIGPEGGWIDREVTTFEQQGFVRTRIVEQILRVEPAIAAVLGQLALVQRMRGHQVGGVG
jgi:16S rRNA (uracil1498-N3)-methyltransferase